MKIKVSPLVMALTALLSFGFLQSGHAAPVAEGAKCLKLNTVVKSGNLSLQCVRSGKKFVYVAKYKKCSDVSIAGRAPIRKDVDPLFYSANSGLDRDKDGIACDK